MWSFLTVSSIYARYAIGTKIVECQNKIARLNSRCQKGSVESFWFWFRWVGFNGISNIVSYSRSNPLYTWVLNIYDLVWLGFMADQPLWVI